MIDLLFLLFYTGFSIRYMIEKISIGKYSFSPTGKVIFFRILCALMLPAFALQYIFIPVNSPIRLPSASLLMAVTGILVWMTDKEEGKTALKHCREEETEEIRKLIEKRRMKMDFCAGVMLITAGLVFLSSILPD